MSTRIYNGRIIRAPIAEAYEMWLGARDGIVRLQRVAQARFLADTVTDALDMVAFYKHRNRPAVQQPAASPFPEGSMVTTRMADADMASLRARRPLSSAQDELKDRQDAIIEEGYRDPAVDFDVNVTLFPVGKVTLAMLFVEHRQIVEYIDALKWLEDYHYQNSSDGPDDVDPMMWAARADMWEQAMGPRMVPADRGLNLQIGDSVKYRLPATVDEVMAQIRDHDARLSRLARNVHRADVLERLEDEAKADTESAHPPAYSRLASVLTSDEEKARIGEFVEMCRPLIRDLTKEDVLGWNPDDRG